MLKMETKTVHVVNASDFDQFMQDEYGVQFSFQADQECADDTAITFTVDGLPLNDWDREKVNSVLEGNHEWNVSADLFSYLGFKGVIPEGDYVVEVW